jgi:hypothetical protein
MVLVVVVIVVWRQWVGENVLCRPSAGNPSGSDALRLHFSPKFAYSGWQVKKMLRGAREEEAKLEQRHRSGSLTESCGGATSEEDEPDGRAGGLSRSLEVRALPGDHSITCVLQWWTLEGTVSCTVMPRIVPLAS